MSKLWGGKEKDRSEVKASAAYPQWSEAPAPQHEPETQRRQEQPPRSERDYVAFEMRDSPRHLHIKTTAQGSFYPNYAYFLNMHFGHDFESVFTLYYSFMRVTVKGRNLGPVVHAIDAGDCKRIYQFHPKQYDPPPPGEPVIEDIDILMANAPDPTSEDE